MEFLDRIRIADTPQDVFRLLGEYARTLVHIPLSPDWWARVDLRDERDVRRCVATLLAIVDATSLSLDDRACASAKEALRVFAVALTRLRARREIAHTIDETDSALQQSKA